MSGPKRPIGAVVYSLFAQTRCEDQYVSSVDLSGPIRDPIDKVDRSLPVRLLERKISMLKRVIIGVIALIAILLIVGYLLPRNFSVSRSNFINAEANEIFASVADLRSWPEWTPWNHEMDPTLEYQYSGPDSQVGFISSWTSEKSGSGTLEITSAEEGRGIVYLLSFEGETPADGVVQITAMKGGCEVLWKMSGAAAPPLGPYFLLMIDSLIEADFEACLAGLKERCE